MFLMSELFNYIGFEGDEHIKYLNSISEITPVLNETYYYINDEFVQTDIYDNSKLLKQFEHVSYYFNYDSLIK